MNVILRRLIHISIKNFNLFFADDDLKFILGKRPKISIYGGYKVNTKAAHNHFLKYSDVRIKGEH